MKRLHIADLFCGAGGTSTGALAAALAKGYEPQLTAINHWDRAVQTHTANHPHARHLCASLDSINPRDLFKPGELDLLWASPECTHHSTARGGKPINEQSRATAWCVLRWADALLPPVILVENVPEFQTWGTLGHDHRPLKTRKGALFLQWVNALEALGYRVEWRVLCAADYGDPTTRRRLFVQAVRGRRRIRWPDPTHAPLDEVGEELFANRQPWRGACEIIDWELEGESIYGRKKPLSEKTMARIWAGLLRYGLRPFITPGMGERVTQAPRTHDVEQPMPTVTAQGHMHLVRPWLVKFRGQSAGSDIRKPIGTITARGEHYALAQPFLLEIDNGSNGNAIRGADEPLSSVVTKARHGIVQPFLQRITGQDKGARARSVEKPMPTVTGSREWGVVEPMLIPQGGGGSCRPVSQPAPTIATDGAIAIVEPYLVKFYGTGRPASVRRPLDAVTTKERFGLCRPVVEVAGDRYELDIRFRMLQPHELAGAQGFPTGYQFTGTKEEQVKQIGNAVPCGMAQALVEAVLV